MTIKHDHIEVSSIRHDLSFLNGYIAEAKIENGFLHLHVEPGMTVALAQKWKGSNLDDFKKYWTEEAQELMVQWYKNKKLISQSTFPVKYARFEPLRPGSIIPPSMLPWMPFNLVFEISGITFMSVFMGKEPAL